MANYNHILYINEDGRNSATKVELRLSDSYSELIDVATTFTAVTNIDISSLTQSIEGDTLNVFSERLQVDLIGAMQGESASNTALVEFFINGVNGVAGVPYPIYCQLLLNEVDMFTGKFDKYTFGYKVIQDNKTNFLHSFVNNDYNFEFEQTGSNILKDIKNVDILTDGAGSFLERLEAITGMIEAKQGAYEHPTNGNLLQTQKLIKFGDFLTELLTELKNYINTNYTLAITTTEINATHSSIGVASGVGTSMIDKMLLDGTTSKEPYAFRLDSSNNIEGDFLKKVTLANNTKELYVYNSAYENKNIFIAASSIFDNVTEAADGRGFFNDEGYTYRIKTSTDNIYDMLALLMYNLSLNFEIRIDNDTLKLNISNLDSIADSQTTIYTGLLDSFEEKIKDETDGETDNTDLEYISIVNAYSYPDGIYKTTDNVIDLKEKPLPLSIMPAYAADVLLSSLGNYAMQNGHAYKYFTQYNINTIGKHTSMFMKIGGATDFGFSVYVPTQADTDNGFNTYRPAEFFAPIGKLAYKVNETSYESFTNIDDRIKYFQKRYNGREKGNLKKDATASIASISDFSLISNPLIEADTSPHNLKCGNNIFLNNTTYFITSVERDFKGVSTKLNLVAEGFFNIDAPVTDDTDDNKGFFPPPTSEGEEPDIIIGVGEPAQSIVTLDVLAYTTTGTLTQFTNTEAYYNEIAGITLTTITSGSVDYVTIQSSGRMENSAWSWTPDAIIYARYNATTSKMELTETEPTPTDGDMLIIMGRAISATVINIGIENYLFE